MADQDGEYGHGETRDETGMLAIDIFEILGREPFRETVTIIIIRALGLGSREIGQLVTACRVAHASVYTRFDPPTPMPPLVRTEQSSEHGRYRVRMFVPWQSELDLTREIQEYHNSERRFREG